MLPPLLIEIAAAPSATKPPEPPNVAATLPASVKAWMFVVELALIPTFGAVTVAPSETRASIVSFTSLIASATANAKTAGGPRAITMATPPASVWMDEESLAVTLRLPLELTVPPLIDAVVELEVPLNERLPAPANEKPPPLPVETAPAIPIVSALIDADDVALI